MVPDVFNPDEGTLASALRAAKDSARREVPLKIMLMPTSVPMTHSLLDGQDRQMRMARIRVTTPSTRSQFAPGMGRKRKDRTNSRMPSMNR